MISSYNYCSKCNITMPKIFSDIHLKACHATLPPNCKSRHPLIRDGEMVSQVTFIKESSTNIFENSRNISNLEEPEFMKSFNYNFTENFAFFNELDLLESHIESFSHICVQVNSSRGVFIAVSTDRNQQQIGTVQFYVKGYEKHFPIHKNVSYVTVRKINKVIEAKKVKLICSNTNFVDEEHLLYRFKNKFSTNYEYGWPYLFRKKGDAVVLQNLALDDFNVKIEIEDDDFANVSMCSVNFNPFGNVTLNVTMDGSKDLSFTEGEKVKSLDISPEHTDENTSVKKTFRSSTPVGGKSKKSARLLTSVYLGDDDNSLVYYWMSKDTTKIEIVTSLKEEQTRDSIVGESESRSQNYYKTKDFYLFKNLVQREFEIEPESLNPQMSRSGLLLMGFPGTGKTAMVEELSKELNLPLITLNILKYTRSGKAENYIMDSFTEAQNNAPSILFFDFFDSFVHKNQNKFSVKILKALKQSKSLEKPVIFIGATNRPDLISPHVRQSGRFDKDFIISLPDAATRAEILLQMLNGEKHTINKEEAITLGKQALGFSPADLDLAVRTSWQKALYEIGSKKKKATKDLCLQRNHIEDGIKEVVPSHLREKYFSISKVLWQNIWGYDHIKEKLKKVTKLLSTERCSKGILFYGPPGCSKTMMAKALATETQFSFFPIKCSDLLSKYVGETEKALCDLLEKAILSSPSLVFIDEIDGLCGRRDGGGGAENSVVPELLSMMRKSYNTGNILFVGATNRPQVLDEVLLSAGYFELLFHVDLPDCASRCAIWRGLLEGVPHQNINIELLCNRTEGFSCAEICSIYQKAAYRLIETKISDLESGEGELDQKDLKLTEDLILNVLSSKSPRTSKSVLEAVKAFASARGSYK